jgi:ankyrin repeat protein
MHSKLLGILIILWGVGGFISILDTVSANGNNILKMVFIGTVQLLVALVPTLFGIGIYRKKVVSKSKYTIWIAIVLAIDICIAVMYKDQIAQRLIRHDTSMKLKQLQQGIPEIVRATPNNDIVNLRQLITNGADVNARDQLGASPLLYARSLEVIKLLVENGADVNVTTKRNTNILNSRNASTYHTSYEATKYLLENGFDRRNINLQNAGKEGTPLHYGDRCHFCKAETYADGINNIKLLLKYGADPNARDGKGETPIFTVKDDAKRVLIENGADIFVISKNNENVLFKIRDADLFKELVGKGLNTRQINVNGESILHHTWNEEIVDLIVENVDIDKQAADGRTALFWCIYNPRKLATLLKHKANGNLTDNKGNTVLHWYVSIYNYQRTDEVLSNINSILETDIDINQRNADGKTALDCSKNDHVKALLRAKGAI